MNKRIKKKKMKQEEQNFKNYLGTILAIGTGLPIPLEYLKADEYIEEQKRRKEQFKQKYIDNISFLYKTILNNSVDIPVEEYIISQFKQLSETMEEFKNE